MKQLTINLLQNITVNWIRGAFFTKSLPTLLLIFALHSVTASEDGQQIVVKLATESRLMPLYIGKFHSESSGLDDTYITKLENVLAFDLSHNGKTYVVKLSPEREAIFSALPFDSFGGKADWQNQNIYFVIKAKIANKKMEVRIFAVNGNEIKTSNAVTLTGELNKDRKSVHQLADTIHKALFGIEGIASTRFLYTVKTQSEGGKSFSEVWEADYDGQNARQLTHEGSFCITPAYVPPKPGFDPGSFFYVSYKTGQSKIYMASLKDGVGHRFSLLKGNQLMPTISRQRDKVAFISDYTGNPDLFLQSFSLEAGAIGKPQQIFSAKHAAQGSPTFSSDGKKVAFVSNKDGNPRVYVMNIPAPGASLNTISPRLISRVNKESTAPVWSPDGTKLAYCAMTNGARQIWVFDFDKNEEYQLTFGGGNKENPTWAPNSLHLIFNSTGHHQSELYLVNLNQPEATKISYGKGDKHYPNWQPR